MHRFNNRFPARFCLKVLIGLMLMVVPWVANSQSADWVPVSSEKLIQLPAGYLDRYVEQDFRRSSLAQSVDAANSAMDAQLSRMTSLRDRLASAQKHEQIDLRHQLLLAKSEYIDAVEEKQRLDRHALDKKSTLYQGLLRAMLKDQRSRNDPVSITLVSQQKAARERMQRSVAVVNEVLDAEPGFKPSQYSEQYRENLARVEALKSAIAEHVANASPLIDGEDVSREEFVRFLLANVESDRALLDQEQLMLGYMARLVALDAHGLEQELMLGEHNDAEGLGAGVKSERLAKASELFVDQY